MTLITVPVSAALIITGVFDCAVSSSPLTSASSQGKNLDMRAEKKILKSGTTGATGGSSSVKGF